MKKVIPKNAVLVPDQADKVFEGMIFDVYQWPQKLFDGSEYTFEMLKRTDTATVICVVDDKLLVIEDEQPHLGKRISLPGGRVDDNDDSTLDAAVREIKEETGCEFINWRLIKVSQPYRKIEWFVYVYLAWDVKTKNQPVLDPGEKIQISEVSFDEFKTLIDQRTDYLTESQDIIENLNNLEDLLSLPEYIGQEVDR